MAMISDKALDVLVVESIGRTRSLTPEGFLLCEGVRVSSTRPMLYRADEIPEVEPRNGMVVMNREPDVLFSPVTLASFQGKSVTNDHPEELLSPSDWKRETVGVVLNPRQGEGVESEFLIADLLITDEEAIEAVQSGRREVSCGYDGEREQVTPGVGRFTKIIGNHVALVERGRCGPACAIGDEEMAAVKTKRSVLDRLRTAFKAKDEAAFEEELEAAANELAEDEPQKVVIELRQPEVQAAGEKAVETELEAEKPEKPVEDEEDEGDIKSMLAKILARLEKLEGGKEPPAEETEDSLTETGADNPVEVQSIMNHGGIEPHSAAVDPGAENMEHDPETGMDCRTMDAATIGVMRAQFQSVIARAEILSPGIKLPTFDARRSRKTIADSMCALRKSALQRALGDANRKGFVTKAIGSDRPNLSKMSCDAMTVAFNAAAEFARMANNAPRANLDHQNFPQGKMTAAAYQEMIAKRRQKPA